MKYTNPNKSTLAIVFVFALIAAGADAQWVKGPLEISFDSYFMEEIGYNGSASFEGRVRNSSDQVFKGVRITAKEIPGWSIEILPEYIDSINPGEQTPFTIKVTPKRSIFLKKESIIITVRSGAAGSVRTLTVADNPRRIWITVGIVLTALIGTGFGFIFWRLNKA
ncbi:MAG: hypothetical protein SVR04_08435 [Spirochaetota bacterium]|nr:hypothetical protein [Spirochaetota bacterium]